MKRVHSFSAVVVGTVALGLWLFQGRTTESQEPPVSVAVSNVVPDEKDLIAPAESIQSGLLLEPPLDLAWFTHERFVKEISTVGTDKIHRTWTSPVVRLPDHPQSGVRGLTEAEVKGYMQHVKQMFGRNEAIPVSDVGLISTQEDVIRQPMLNHIAAFENSAVRVFLLVQRTVSDEGWSYFSIVQDLTIDPPIDYYGQIFDADVKFEGTSCYKCHSSGPLAIHPAREDLVLDAPLAAAVSQYIAEQPRSEFYFPPDSPRPPIGKPLALSICMDCHDERGDRATLYQVHAHPIRILVDFGYMPPDQRLSPSEVAELKAWLDNTGH